MARMDWFRLYSEARTDKKLEALTDAQHRVWFNLLCFASDQALRGTITVPDVDLLALECARGDTDLLQSTLDRLSKLRIIAISPATDEGELLMVHFIHFKDRQYDKPSDQPESVSDRVKRHRENKRVPETPCNAVKRDETPVTPREEESRKEEIREEESSSTARPFLHDLDTPLIDKTLYTLQLQQHNATPEEIAYAESEMRRRKAEPRKWTAAYMFPIIRDLRERKVTLPPASTVSERDWSKEDPGITYIKQQMAKVSART